jgi:hypothetical protein
MILKLISVIMMLARCSIKYMTTNLLRWKTILSSLPVHLFSKLLFQILLPHIYYASFSKINGYITGNRKTKYSHGVYNCIWYQIFSHAYVIIANITQIIVSICWSNSSNKYMSSITLSIRFFWGKLYALLFCHFGAVSNACSNARGIT